MSGYREKPEQIREELDGNTFRTADLALEEKWTYEHSRRGMQVVTSVTHVNLE